jgi:hypothetical protein
MAPPWQMPKARRRLPGGLAGNALVASVVSVIVAGLISFYVARWQSQDAAKQATSAQQVAAVVQLESAASTFYQGTITLLISCYSKPGECPDLPPQSPWITDQATFNADRANVSDLQVAVLAAQLDDDAANAIDYAGVGQVAAQPYRNLMAVAYQQLLARCGQFVQGR